MKQFIASPESVRRDWRETIREQLAPAKLDSIAEAEMVEELAQHLEDRYQELLADGIPDEECRRRAQAELDDRELLVAAALRARRPRVPTSALGTAPHTRGWMHALPPDLRIAFRNIRIKPWFSLMVIGMLALGIACNAAVFSVCNTLFLRPSPFAESDRLIDLDETAPRWSLQHVGVSNLDFYAWRNHNSTFDSMAFFRDPSYNLSDRGTAQRIEGAQVHAPDVGRPAPEAGAGPQL